MWRILIDRVFGVHYLMAKYPAKCSRIGEFHELESADYEQHNTYGTGKREKKQLLTIPGWPWNARRRALTSQNSEKENDASGYE